MSTLRARADDNQARFLGSHLSEAEQHLRRALVDVRGLNRRRAGQVHDMIRRLQVIRLELGVERLDPRP